MSSMEDQLSRREGVDTQLRFVLNAMYAIIQVQAQRQGIKDFNPTSAADRYRLLYNCEPATGRVDQFITHVIKVTPRMGQPSTSVSTIKRMLFAQPQEKEKLYHCSRTCLLLLLAWLEIFYRLPLKAKKEGK